MSVRYSDRHGYSFVCGGAFLGFALRATGAANLCIVMKFAECMMQDP